MPRNHHAAGILVYHVYSWFFGHAHSFPQAGSLGYPLWISNCTTTDFQDRLDADTGCSTSHAYVDHQPTPSPGPLLRGFYFPHFTPRYRTFDVLVCCLQGFLLAVVDEIR